MDEMYKSIALSENNTPEVIYRFDYMKEWVLQFRPECIKNLTVRDVLMLPWDIALPWFTFEEYIPARDHYGVYIEDIEEWSKQRKEYAEKLVKEIKFKIRHGIFDQKKELEILRNASSGCNREENKEG
jgi:hypothetical protein